MEMDERLFWMGLNLVKGIGPVRFRALLQHFGDPQSAWEAPATELRAAGLNNKIVDSMLQVRASVDLQEIWEQLTKEEITLLTWLDEAYPRRLKEIDQPPPVLYVRGQITPADDWAVAMVGTRRITPYGRRVTEEVAAYLAAQGITVVSGLARGIDSAAHQAALKAGGRSIAVMGCGLDQVYPPENRRLAHEMLEQGALISDYPLGTRPEAVNFPPRNRIISGISLATVVVEAGRKSGALITAEFAAEQGREVFAVPNQLYAPEGQGTNYLIQQGAHPLLRPEDLIEVLELELIAQHQTARTVLPADATEAALFAVLGQQPLHIDEIGRQSSLPIEQVSAALALMELKGLVRQVGGMQYVAVREVRADYGSGSV
jgi:DNA processing protein